MGWGMATGLLEAGAEKVIAIDRDRVMLGELDVSLTGHTGKPYCEIGCTCESGFLVE